MIFESKGKKKQRLAEKQNRQLDQKMKRIIDVCFLQLKVSVKAYFIDNINIPTMNKTKNLIKINSLNQTPMHKSQVTNSLDRLVSANNVHQSFISSYEDRKSDFHKEPLKRQYKYERVNNMFKLVQVKSNHEENVCQKSKIETEQLIQTVADLSKRVKMLEKKSEDKEEKDNELSEKIQHNTSKSDYLEEKIRIVYSSVKEIKQQVKEIFDKQSVYDAALHDIQQLTKFINIMKENTALQIKNWRGEVDKKIFELQEQIKKDKSSLVNKIAQDRPENPEFQTQSWPLTNFIRKKLSKKELLTYRETYSREEQTYLINERTYRVDSEGKLLDNSGFYILDNSNFPIKLSEEHLTKLRDFGILR